MKLQDINTSSSHDIEESQFTSTSELLEVARVSLTRSHTKFHDIYFVLLCTVHQLLAAVSVSNGKSEDPIDCIGKSLRLMEVLVTLTMSMDANIIRQVSSKMLSSHPGSVSRYEQRRYYSKEILAMSQQLRKSFRGMNDTEEWWLSSTEATTFLQVYFTITCALFQKIMAGPSKRNQNQAVAAQISSLCRHLVEQEENIEFIARKADGGHDSLFDDLKLLLASYTMICCCLEKSGVEVDLEHIFSINIPFPALSRKEVLCCFLRLWTRQIGDNNVVNDQANETFNTVVQVAVSYAFPVGALPHLMKFALASRSSKINSCLQAICTTAKFLPGGPIDDVLHWQACETYVSECVSILKQMGIRRQFKYFYREAGCNSEAPQFPLDKGFSGYYETLSAAIAGIPKRCSLSTSPLWEFSHHDKYLRARVINLIARITWHLEACASGISSIFQQAFMINCFETSSDTKDHLFHDSVSIARKIITPQDTELHLPMFQQSLNPHPKLPFRSQKIARSLVLIAWILWLREKAAYCSRYYRLLKNRDEISTVHEIESLGDLAATCALHLHTLGTVSGGTEELLNVQLSLLEKAVAENPIKCATILAWGFPACKISTRYIKRYKALRLDIPNLPTNTCLEERELEYRNIQNHIRQGFQHAQGNQKMNSELNADDIDVLVGCCCDQECLQILSALAKVPFEAAITKVSTPERIGDVNKPANEAPPAIDELVISSSSQDNPNPALICTIKENMEPQISESLISRDEVIALLQAQTRHLEEKINAVTIMDGKAESIPPSRIEYLKETEVTLPQSNDTKHDQNITTPEKVVSDDAKTELLDLQRIARISLQVRDLNRHRYASANAQSSIRVNQNTKPAERHDSVRNALKLFHLRRESGDRLCMGEKSLTRGNRNRASNVEENVVITATSSDDFLKCNNSKRTSGQTKSTKNTRRNQSEHFLPREPVCPLRHEYGIDSASLKLLSRSARHRNLSIKKKLFVQQDCERVNPAKLCQAKPKVTINFANSDEVLEMKSASAQTNKAAEVSIAPIDREVSNTFYREENDISPGKSSPVTQEFSENRPVVCPEVVSMNRGVGIQCRVSYDRPVRNLRKKRGPPQLNIAEKFPIWVDLDVANSSGVKSHFKERKRFLQVARFSGPSTTTNNDENPQVFTISPSGSATVSRKLASEDGSEENQSDGKQSPSAGHTLEDRVFDGINEVTMAKYRSSYRQQYPIKERSSAIRDDRDSTSGIDTLIDLRDDMHRMTHRLQVLETCANSIDEEFRVSQKVRLKSNFRLSRIGDKSSGTTSLQTQVLQDIDEVLETTQESDRQAKGLLSKKASNDLDAAKYVLILALASH
ncbi:unnamed protein product [Phytophthora lilii]|uniref:Unnamed protein product n=1 Tax=Phytophthora lilii TaxID=2077276 RepID=A0A9W6YJM4_9STRA|nr:unnamed protein product [Phytophthora lilii]